MTRMAIRIRSLQVTTMLSFLLDVQELDRRRGHRVGQGPGRIRPQEQPDRYGAHERRGEAAQGDAVLLEHGPGAAAEDDLDVVLGVVGHDDRRSRKGLARDHASRQDLLQGYFGLVELLCVRHGVTLSLLSILTVGQNFV
jgi:hypothetical protein